MEKHPRGNRKKAQKDENNEISSRDNSILDTRAGGRSGNQKSRALEERRGKSEDLSQENTKVRKLRRSSTNRRRAGERCASTDLNKERGDRELKISASREALKREKISREKKRRE